MTDRLKGFVVTLEEDHREDDAEPIADALMMIKGVISVEPVVRNVDDLMNRERVRRELLGQVLDLIEKDVPRGRS